jgi:hypothetical protein
MTDAAPPYIDPIPAAAAVRERPSPSNWGVIDADGNRACWWCLATVHPSVAALHDSWHEGVWIILGDLS